MKLTKEDIDKVRDIEGFPIAKDEDIIGLSNPPYYTACPNPFIEDFIRENGKPYDEDSDDYHREPFATDVSEGKSDTVYMAHSYHTKVPYRAIMKYILHYTNPGDLVLDAFCGSGMTGVAVQSCSDPDFETRLKYESEQKNVVWGTRKVILNDLAPAATFITYNCNRAIDAYELENEIEEWLEQAKRKINWIYLTKHSEGENGEIAYVVWSQMVVCPNCGRENIYYELVTENGKTSKSKFVNCKFCSAETNKVEFAKATEIKMDKKINETIVQIKRIPIKIFYKYNGKTYEKKPDDEDLKLLDKIEEYVGEWYPTEKMMFKGSEWGEFWRAGYHVGITRVHHFYTKRNIEVLAELYSTTNLYKYGSIMQEILVSSLARASIRNRYIPEYGNRHVGTLSGTLYVPPLFEENNLFEAIKGRGKKIVKAVSLSNNNNNNYIISTGSNTDMKLMDNCIDYIFTDPPFGNNLIYSELNFISETWLKTYTNSETESIISTSQKKNIEDYKELMIRGFKEYFRVLKPNRWITVEFHNSQNAVWNVIQETLQNAGFIIADVRTLDKEKGTTKQMSYSMAVQQDLVISAYKPKNKFLKNFVKQQGTNQGVWEFVSQHLENLPIIVEHNKKIEIVAERQAFLLFDRMVAYHIINGVPVPIDASDFYRQLNERYLLRDSMYFLQNQVNEYDTKRIFSDVEEIQFELFITNEKNARAWLYQQLVIPQTYGEIQPKYMQELKAVDKYETIPELAILLEENFLQDENGRWYIPDVTKEADVTKLREKKLLKEFEGYMAKKGKLKVFRTEAIRVGFAKLWSDKQYQLIVDIADRLPESVIQEDDKLLMYYDISSGRI